jgi:hypothetical protein
MYGQVGMPAVGRFKNKLLREKRPRTETLWQTLWRESSSPLQYEYCCTEIHQISVNGVKGTSIDAGFYQSESVRVINCVCYGVYHESLITQLRKLSYRTLIQAVPSSWRSTSTVRVNLTSTRITYSTSNQYTPYGVLRTTQHTKPKPIT